MDGITEVEEKSKFEKAVGLFFKNSERVSFIILLLWCALPVFMVAFNLICGAIGAFPTELPEGMKLGAITYRQATNTYYAAFRIVGFITLVYAALAAAVSYKRIFSKAGFFNQPWLYVFGAFLIWAAVSTALADDPYFAFVGGNYMHNGLLSYFFYGALFVCASMITDKKLRRIIMLVFFGVLSLLCVIMILQHCNIYFILYCFPSNGSAVFNNSNHFGYVLCIGVAAAAGMFLFGDEKKVKEGGNSITSSTASREPPKTRISFSGNPGARPPSPKGKVPVNKIISLCFLTLFTVTLLVNNTFGAFIGAAFGLAAAYVFYFVRRGKVKWYVFIPALIFIILTVLNCVNIIPSTTPIFSDILKTVNDVGKIAANDPGADSAGSSRWVLWKNAFQRVLERPIFGFGPEGFYGEHALDSQNTGTHNEYLEMAGYLGISALLLYLAALILIVIKQWKNLKRLDPLVVAAAGGSVAYLVSAFFGAPVFNTFPFFCMFLGFTSIGVTEPVICLKNTEAKKQLFANAKKKYVIIAIVALIAVICTVFAVIMAKLVRQTEKTSETADMHCMNGAIKTVALRLKDNAPDEPTDYWYDANSLSLIPVSEEKPMPYGMGTALKGGASADFASEFGSDFGYDEGTDYTDKIIKLTVSKNDEDKLDVKMEWVQGRKK